MAANMKRDPEFEAFLASQPTAPPPSHDTPPSSPAEGVRRGMEATISPLAARWLPIPDTVKETKHTITSYDGADITIYEFTPVDLLPTSSSSTAGPPSPAILYLHGGGNISCQLETMGRASLANFALENAVRSFGVEFRLAPEHPFPTPLEDCYAALKWASENAAQLGIDAGRIGLFGQSGGANLAAGVSLLARDRQLSPPIARQLLIYPMLDDRSSERHALPESERNKSLGWFADMIDICWDAYLGGKKGDQVPVHAAPARAEDLKGLPPTYIDVGGLDWFRDESLEFATRLAKADVDVEFHLYPGLPHCFDLMAPDISVTKNAKDNRLRQIRSI